MGVKFSSGRKAVSSDHYLASLAGIKVLENGGNAFDAAIAVSAVLSVVQPHLGGPGGDGFLLGFIGDEVIAYASAGRSPSGFDPARYMEEKPTRGPLTVTVPGLVHLWGFVSEEYGSMPLGELLRPAISLAYNGFYAGYSLASASRVVERELAKYKVSRYYSNIKPGDLVVNRDMARALRLIATRGWEDFYYGSLAEEIVGELQDQGVEIGLDDLMEHESYRVTPLKLGAPDGRVLYELPPSTQGATSLQLISALYELGLDKYAFEDSARISAWFEPTWYAYAFRDLYIGDPDYMTINIDEYLSYSHVKKAVETAKPHSANKGGDTTFFVVTDGEAMVGFIQSLFHPFGSGLIATGFPVQARGTGFATASGLPNSPAPRKIPLHTLSIMGVEDGADKYVIGCVGGHLRPQLHLRVYENLFVYKMDIVKAVNAPRFYYVDLASEQTKLVVEEPLKNPPISNRSLIIERAGYQASNGHVHVGVLRRSGAPILANDPRSEGVALSTLL